MATGMKADMAAGINRQIRVHFRVAMVLLRGTHEIICLGMQIFITRLAPTMMLLTATGSMPGIMKGEDLVGVHHAHLLATDIVGWQLLTTIAQQERQALAISKNSNTARAIAPRPPEAKAITKTGRMQVSIKTITPVNVHLLVLLPLQVLTWTIFIAIVQQDVCSATASDNGWLIGLALARQPPMADGWSRKHPSAVQEHVLSSNKKPPKGGFFCRLLYGLMKQLFFVDHHDIILIKTSIGTVSTFRRCQRNLLFKIGNSSLSNPFGRNPFLTLNYG